MLSTLNAFHFSNGGNPDISLNLPGAAFTAAAPSGKKGILAAILDSGFTTTASATCAPIPITFAPGLNKPYFKPRDKPLPNKGMPAPITAPS